MISIDEYNKALEVIAAYRKQEGEKLEQVKQERLQRMLEKKEWCEKNGGHHYLPDGKYSSEGAKTCQDCGHKIT